MNECDRIKPFGTANSHIQSESVKSRRLSLLRKSLGWDNAFFTSAGLLSPEEVFMINKGFKKAESSQPLSGTHKPHRVCKVKSVKPPKINQQIISNPEKNSKVHSYESIRRKINPKNTKLPTSPSSVLSPLSSTCSSTTRSPTSCHNATSASDFQTPSLTSCQYTKEKKLTSQHARTSSTKKIKTSGLQTPSNPAPSVSTKNCSKVGKNLIPEHNGKKVGVSCSNVNTNQKMHKNVSKNRINIERKSHDDRENMCSFEDRVSGLSKQLEVKGQLSGQLSHVPTAEDTTPCSSTPLVERMLESARPRRLSYLRKSLDLNSVFFTNAGLLDLEELCIINKGFKKANFNELSSTSSLKSIRTKTSPRNTKSSVISPLSPACSSSTSTSTSPCSYSDFQSHSHEYCKSFEEIKLTSQYSTRSYTRKVESSGLRMPSPKIGFFDEVQLPSYRTPIFTKNCSKVKNILNTEHDGSEIGASCSKIKTNERLHNDISKNRTNIEIKTQKVDRENRCSFEDQVNGLKFRQIVTEVKGQHSFL